MKIKHLFITLFWLPLGLLGQTTFVEHPVDSSINSIGINVLFPVDINKDGKEDIAFTGIGKSKIYASLNLGSNTFGAAQELADSIDFPQDISLADYNGNGWPDLAAVSITNKALYASYNQGGNFGNTKLIGSGYAFPSRVFSEDFNGDSHIDIVTVDDTVVYFYENDGAGNFTKNTLAGKTEFYCGGVADVNGDGHLDVMLGSIKLYTYINNGNGTFTRDMRNEALINDFIFEIELADVDGDGDNDMAIYYSNTNPNIDVYENDGTGLFSLSGSITTTSNDVKSMKFADFNNDSLPDFVTAYGQTGTLVWMENLGGGSFSAEKVLKNYPILLREVAVSDVDNDGDIDIFCGHNNGGIYLWENQTNAVGIKEYALVNSIYPNPAKEEVNITFVNNGSAYIYSVDGKELASYSNLKPGKNTLNLNLSKGLYFLKWVDGKQQFSTPLRVEK